MRKLFILLALVLVVGCLPTMYQAIGEKQHLAGQLSYPDMAGAGRSRFDNYKAHKIVIFDKKEANEMIECPNCRGDGLVDAEGYCEVTEERPAKGYKFGSWIPCNYPSKGRLQATAKCKVCMGKGKLKRINLYEKVEVIKGN